MTDSASPFVYWAQDANNLFLKVDLTEAKNEKIVLEGNKISFTARGVGAGGPARYGFALNLFDELESDEEVHDTRLTERAVDIVLRKKKPNTWWPRLIKQQQKPAWLKVDFERWKSEDDDLSETDKTEVGDVIGDYPELYEKLKKKELGYKKEDLKQVYLVFYNLTQFILFSYILIVMGIRYSKDGPDSMEGTYEAVGPALKFAQLLQYLEVMHPMFGYTKGSIALPFVQVTGRAVILFAMIEAEPRMQTKPVIFYLTIAWSLIEIVRYPFYIAAAYKKEIDLLTWLRYTLWIPLYPWGIVCEGIIILRNIPYFEETQKFVVSLPNAWNITFHTPTVMKLYLLMLFFPGTYAVMTHMYRARCRKLSHRKIKRKSA